MLSRTSWKPSQARGSHARSPSPPADDAADWFEAHEVAAAISTHRDKLTARKRRRQDIRQPGIYTSHTNGSGLNGAMDALSSVALEYQPQSPYSHRHSASATAAMADERPSKRVKSDRFFSSGESKDHGRPMTSYTRPPPSLNHPTTQEAELLLNFFATARATPSQTSPTTNGHTRSVSFGQSPSIVNNPHFPSSDDPLPQYQSSYAHPSHAHEQTMQLSPTLPPTQLPPHEAITQEEDKKMDEGEMAAPEQVNTIRGQATPTQPSLALNGVDASNGLPDSQGASSELHIETRADAEPHPGLVDPALGILSRATQVLQGQGADHDLSTSLHHQLANAADENDIIVKSEGDEATRDSATAASGSKGQAQDGANLDELKSREIKEQICTACGFHRNNLTLETENEATSWISCDGCEKWFHFACAGFKSEREVRSVDKFRCKACKPIHGATTYVRKSGRAHVPIDYAELNQGVVKTSEESPEHHYIKPIKEGTIKFAPETFARIRPELITSDFWLRGEGMQEPVVIPAEWNLQPRRIPRPEDANEEVTEDPADDGWIHDQSALESDVSPEFEYQQVPDEGQDALDMVIPRDLTVRRVAKLYGPEEKLEVIDVKSQNGEDKRWNMRKWADYYESDAPNKPVRNVISLEVSQSRLGSLIRRPKVVRDLDLQDSVWPQELVARGDYPKVQFYCLMSVADCYTDFHIDFGGSSVYYHIIKGKKTFFFIPPTETNLKKYEDWCNSDAQNYTFLGDQTKLCYRVDLGPGDTMLIPAGWIHAVWTPEDSLVIGGNFLTRQNYPMQIRITQIEKATGVARKFRYPSFQKIMWYAVINYLTEDPLPKSVEDMLLSGKKYEREDQTWEDYDAWGEDSSSGPGTDEYHSRYYPKCELDGLPELARYIQRTAYIAAGYVTDGVSSDTKRAVQRSIPKEYKLHGAEPVDCVRKFATWYCWKRGNEFLPHWAYPDYVPEANAPEVTQKKLSAAHMRRLEREAAMTAERVSDRPQRERKQPSNLYNEMMTEQEKARATRAPSPGMDSPLKQETPVANTAPVIDSPSNKKESQPKKRKSSGGIVNRLPACEACRRGRRACKHRELPQEATSVTEPSVFEASSQAPGTDQIEGEEAGSNVAEVAVGQIPSQLPDVYVLNSEEDLVGTMAQTNGEILAGVAASANAQLQKDSATPGRSKACADCRKSKRRCIHDEFGRQDPVKMAQAAQPRPAAKKKRPSDATETTPQAKKSKKPATPRQSQHLADDAQMEGQQPMPVAPMGSMSTALTAGTQQPTPMLASDMLSQADEDVPFGRELVDDSMKPQVPRSMPQDTSSALVSPPESAHTDHEQTASPAHTPRPTVEAAVADGKGRDLTPPTTASAPRSRRPSLIPASLIDPQLEQSRAMSTLSSDSKALDAMITRRASSNTVNDVDEETLKVIKDLAAQDRGLRRRDSRLA